MRDTPGVSGHELGHLVHVYGCGLVFIVVALQALGAPLPGTTALIAAALYAASSHSLPIAGVIAAGAAGLWRGPAWPSRSVAGGDPSCCTPSRGDSVRAPSGSSACAPLRGGGPAMIVLGRFVTGLRNVTGLLAGASAMSARRFVAVSAGAAVLWATVNGLEYYWFGRALQAADTWVQVLLVVLGLSLTV